jgi:hypothetical protein
MFFVSVDEMGACALRREPGWSLTNTTKISIEVPLLSSHFLGIIRIGREGVEKRRVAGLMSGGDEDAKQRG